MIILYKKQTKNSVGKNYKFCIEVVTQGVKKFLGGVPPPITPYISNDDTQSYIHLTKEVKHVRKGKG